ncbi:hypothetical protein RKD05_001562 [Microbacterium sp. SLBN-111]
MGERAVQVGDLLGVPEEEVGAELEFRPRLRERLAALERHDLGDGIPAFEEQPVRAGEQVGPVARRDGSPCGLRGGRGIQRRLAVRGGAVGDARDLNSGCRVVHREVSVTGAPLAVDEEIQGHGMPAQSRRSRRRSESGHR